MAQLEACPHLPAPVHAPQASCDSQSDRIRRAIELRSECARAILASHKHLLVRPNSEPNLVLCAQVSPLPCRPTETPRQSLAELVTAKERSLPQPLTDAVLDEVYTQLSSGAKRSIPSVIQSDRIRKAIELRSERARAIQASHKHLIVRPNSEPNLVFCAQVSPSHCRPIETSCPSSLERVTAKERSLPQPLTDAVLDEAYTQLSSGAKRSIQCVIQWWRTNKLSAHEVLATVESFTSSSAALRKMFASATPESQKAGSRHDLITIPSIEGKVASDRQMHKLMHATLL